MSQMMICVLMNEHVSCRNTGARGLELIDSGLQSHPIHSRRIQNAFERRFSIERRSAASSVDTNLSF